MFWAPRLYQCFLMSFVIKNWIFESLQFSLSIPCATTNKKKKKLSYHRSTEQRNPLIMYGFRSDILFPSFLSLNLCMSLWFHCSHTAVQRKSYTKRWNEKAVWGDIESQVNSTPGNSAELKCFPLFWIPLLSLDVPGNEDVEMASQNPGTVQLQAKAPVWTRGVITCYCQCADCHHSMHHSPRGTDCTSIWLLSLEKMGIVRADQHAAHCSGFHLSSEFDLRSNLISLVSSGGITSIQSSECICTGWMNRPWDSDMLCCADSEGLKWIESVCVCVCYREATINFEQEPFLFLRISSVLLVYN